MADYRRYFVPGGTYFFTLVTANRAPLFWDDAARTLLGGMMREVRDDASFETVAIVLLPEHLHAIWTLPSGDANYPDRWKAIKAKFSHRWLEHGGNEQRVSRGYRRQRRRGIWQPRFMEQTIRDEADLHAHADYIHYNPGKHGLIASSKEWPWSSFHRLVASGDHPLDWGRGEVPTFDGVDDSLIE